MAVSGNGEAQRLVDCIQSNFAEMGAALTKTVSALHAPLSVAEPDAGLSPDDRTLARAEARAKAQQAQGKAELWAMAELRTRLESIHGAAVEELAATAALGGIVVDRTALKAPFEHFSNMLRSHGPDSTHARRLQVIATKVDTFARASAHLIDIASKLGCGIAPARADETAGAKQDGADTSRPLLPASKTSPWWAAKGFALEPAYASLRSEIDDAIARLADANDDAAVAAILPGLDAEDIAHCRIHKTHPLDHWAAGDVADLVESDLDEILSKKPHRDRYTLKNGAEVSDDTLQRMAVQRYRYAQNVSKADADGSAQADRAASLVAQLHDSYDELAKAYGASLDAHVVPVGAVELDPAITDPDEAREAAQLDASERRGYGELVDCVLLRQRIEKDVEQALDALIIVASRPRVGATVDRAALCGPLASLGDVLRPEHRHADRVKWLRDLLSHALPQARRHLTELAAKLHVQLLHGRDWLPCGDVPWNASTETDDWRKLKAELRTLERAGLLRAFGVDEDGLRALEAQRDQLQRMAGWSNRPGEAHAADVWAVRDIERTPRTLDQVFHDGDYGSGANPDRQYRVAGATDMLDPSEIQARACRHLRTALERPASAQPAAKAEGVVRPEQEAPKPEHSRDFTSVTFGPDSYRFSKRQAAAVEVLWGEWARGTPTIAEETIAEALDPDSERDPKRFRLRDLFKGKTKGKNGEARSAMHPAWGKIITVSGGIAQLAFTEKGISPS